MNFRRGQAREEPEMNLIPLIDVLMVILIFMMVTTTYSKFAELQINLPQATGEKTTSKSNEINVAVDASEHYAINNTSTTFASPESFAEALRKVGADMKDPTIIINADAKATHQSVVNIMEAARIAKYSRITFTTQK